MLFKHFDDPCRNALTHPQQRTVCSVPRQRMLEQVIRMRRHALAEQQPGCNETVQRRFQLSLLLCACVRKKVRILHSGKL